MAKQIGLDNVSKALDKVESLFDKPLDFGQAITETETSEHENVIKISERFSQLSDKLKTFERQYAEEQVKEIGQDIASEVGDAAQLKRIMELFKAGKLDAIIKPENEPKVQSEVKQVVEQRPIVGPSSSGTVEARPQQVVQNNQQHSQNVEHNNQQSTQNVDKSNQKTNPQPVHNNMNHRENNQNKFNKNRFNR